MKWKRIVQKVILWWFFAVVIVGAVVYFPSAASVLLLITAVLALPFNKIQDFLSSKKITWPIRIGMLIVLFFVSIVLAPTQPEHEVNRSIAPTPSTTQAEPTESNGPEEEAGQIKSGTYTLPCGMNIQFFDSVRNDVTGNWRRATTSDSYVPADYALEYYNEMFSSDDEIHSVWNATLGTNTRMSVAAGMLYVDTLEYVKGEEHDAKLMFSGKLLDSKIIDIKTGEPESPASSDSPVPTERGSTKDLAMKYLAEYYPDCDVSNLIIDNGKLEARVQTSFPESLESPDGWGEICKNAIASSIALHEAMGEAGINRTVISLKDSNGNILLTLSEGNILYDKYKLPDPTPEPTPSPDPISSGTVTIPTQTRTIYITETGSRYHYDSNCNGGTYIASTLEQAISMGLTPCKRCVE